MAFKLSWQAEKFSPTGSSTSEGIRNQLGRPDLDPLTVLVREAAQNSWDARLGEAITFGIAGRRLAPDEKKFFRDILFPDRAPNLLLERLWENNDQAVLAIYDRGTTGLNGPTRADQVSDGSEKNFVAFLRNIGHARKDVFGGGTYGYGKAVFYSISCVRAICVHTKCRVDGAVESRFMSAALGERYGRFTGRHWWGTKGTDGIVDPVRGDDADEISERISLPKFKRGETGTTILVLLPDFGETETGDEESRKRTAEEAMCFMGASMLWHFWPKLIRRNNSEPAIHFELSWNGVDISVPDPAKHVAFHGFVKAMSSAHAVMHEKKEIGQTKNEQVRKIECRRPIRELGVLSLFRYMSLSASSLGGPMETAMRQLAPAKGNFHHVALMRTPEIVVRYEAGPPCEGSQYVGVFLVNRNEEVDKAFADSEPPTHDDWEPSMLEGWGKTFVRVALRRIKEGISEFALSGAAAPAPGTRTPLGALSEQLAGLIGGMDGTSPSVKPVDSPTRVPSRTSQPRATGPRLEIFGEPILTDVHGKAACSVSFRLLNATGNHAVSVTAIGRVAVMDGAVFENDEDVPEGAETPHVLAWQLADGTSLPHAGRITIAPKSLLGTHRVLVSIPEGCIIGVFMDVEKTALK